MFGGCVKVRESLFTQNIIWVDTILNHIDIGAILSKYAGFCMVHKLEWYQKHNYYHEPIPH